MRTLFLQSRSTGGTSSRNFCRYGRRKRSKFYTARKSCLTCRLGHKRFSNLYGTFFSSVTFAAKRPQERRNSYLAYIRQSTVGELFSGKLSSRSGWGQGFWFQRGVPVRKSNGSERRRSGRRRGSNSCHWPWTLQTTLDDRSPYGAYIPYSGGAFCFGSEKT